jgi:medium-chain acyl-[acyl-carrier-protein] hydrolase
VNDLPMFIPHPPSPDFSAYDLSLWVPALRSEPGASIRLITFPYAGGGTPVFRPWLELLPANIELRTVQLPGRGPRFREKHILDLAVAIDALEAVLLPLLDRPCAFFGHSVGALLAFEMARRLAGRGLTPAHLFLSGKNAPHFPDSLVPLHQLPDPLFLGKLRELNGMAEAVLDSPELLELLLPVIRSDFTVLETYSYRPSALPLSCPITVLGGDQDPRTLKGGLNAWREQTAANFNLTMFGGDHFFIDKVRPELIKIILRELSRIDVS